MDEELCGVVITRGQFKGETCIRKAGHKSKGHESARQREMNNQRQAKRQRERMHSDPEWRELRNRQSKEYNRRNADDPKWRERQREHANKHYRRHREAMGLEVQPKTDECPHDDPNCTGVHSRTGHSKSEVCPTSWAMAMQRNRRWMAANPDAGQRGNRLKRERLANLADLYADMTRLDGDRCYLCGQKAEPRHVEHVLPIASNPGFRSVLRVSCESCNLSKGSKPLAQFVRSRETLSPVLAGCVSSCPIWQMI